MRLRAMLGSIAAIYLFAQASVAAAQDEAAPAAAEATASSAAGDATATTAEKSDEAKVKFSGTVEAAYGYSFNSPSNAVINNRYYDARHNLPGLQAAMLDVAFEKGEASGHLQLQFGAMAELFWPTTRSVEQDVLWRLIQEASAKWTTPLAPLSIEGGVFNTPFGPEYNVAYMNWNWSTSNLFAIMPYQIGGLRANWEFGRGLRARAGVYNGWDRVVKDNNAQKSLMFSLEWDNPDDEETYVYLNYMVGNERGRDDPLGNHLRHTVDLYGQWHVSEKLFLRAHVLTGYEGADKQLVSVPGVAASEPTLTDASNLWLGAAVSGKYALTEWFSVVARGDLLKTVVGGGGVNPWHADYTSDPSQSTLVASGTLTLDVHTGSHASLRLEGRYDYADFPLFFGGAVPVNEGLDVATEKRQATATLALATWF